jgi:hypothetical protein
MTDQRLRAAVSLRLLAFGAAIVAFAFLYAVADVGATEFLSIADTESTTAAQAQGITWVEQMWLYLPVFGALLLAIKLINDAVFDGGVQ